MWLGRGKLYVEDGTLHFLTAGFDDLEPGDYTIPFQMASCFLLQPGTTITHDVLRLMARHGTGAVAVGEGGIRFYASMPFGPDSATRARRQAGLWADFESRIRIVKKMYAWRLGEELPATDLDALRGIEGSRVKRSYQLAAQRYGVRWKGRRYDRANPESTDPANLAINHASSAVQAIAAVAVAVTGTIPQLGFIHEDSGIAFVLDIADLYRDEVLLPVAFQAVKRLERSGGTTSIDYEVRKLAAETFRSRNVVRQMIDRIKELMDDDDRDSDSERA